MSESAVAQAPSQSHWYVCLWSKADNHRSPLPSYSSLQ